MKSVINQVLIVSMYTMGIIWSTLPMIQVLCEKLLGIDIPIENIVETSMIGGKYLLSMFLMYNALEFTNDLLYPAAIITEAQLPVSTMLDLKSCVNNIPEDIVDAHRIKIEISKCLVKSSL